ncbi:uncharacterized protein VDAG_06980 [Verticillium dahliae VdLs.17]|uniref:Survival Motor Neuron Gemin2-binding domain-containing protein n=1 Tax=Verticillium dahliae (strain VdLs.17 / ATCC MYA-4575 / FGSC 10137) TaxID=498257 RepID=G2XA77_VERDV|nr:uncharacterized protein VDAG_06980 [Verticillium dahliae VdLs.17]EGY15816.1 hypothetical protein VDAG_06980 [Verticillium dahliae VdLs.17]
MTVSEDQLTHEEVWDDSALIDSWNEALDEYKARQNRALVPSTNRSDRPPQPRASTTSNQKRGKAISQLRQICHPVAWKNPIKSVKSWPRGIRNPAGILLRPLRVTPGTAPPTALVSESRDTPGDATAVASPQVLLGTVQDEGLKKLLMSWYYAGYYTGLYEGQQQQRTQPSAP